jgi:hypothetical protein
MERLFLCRPLCVDDRLERLVPDANPLGGAAPLFRMLRCDERNRLPEVAHALIGEHGLVLELEAVALLAGDVLVRQHRAHAGHADRLGDVDRHDAGVGMRAAQGVTPEHPGGLQIARVGEFTRDLRNAVDARDALTDASEPQLRRDGLAHRPPLGR